MKQMKERILLAIIILLIGFQANAQEEKFNLVLKIAPAVSWLDIKNSAGVSSDFPVVKFNGGGILIYNLSKNFGLASGINYNTLGGKVRYYDSSYDTYNYAEIQIPFILQMKSKSILNSQVFIQLGIAGSMFTQAEDDDGNSLWEGTKAFNSAYIISGGVYYPMGDDMMLAVQLKYNGGLRNIFDNSSKIYKDRKDEIKINFVELSIGVMF